MKKILVVFGTRPEAIKMAPVIKQLEASQKLKPVVCVTGQHREMLDQVIDYFKIHVDYDLALMKPNQSLTELTSRALLGISKVIAESEPDVVLCQGDTTTAMTAALAGFYNQVPVGHIEAGLRTGEMYDPFPEEINRQMISTLATFNFVPTVSARDALFREGFSPERIFLTGNTVIDALLWTVEKEVNRSLPVTSSSDEKIVLVTTHRRESFGKPLESICEAIATVVKEKDDIRVVIPVHLNPRVREVVYQYLDDVDRIDLIEPLAYPDFAHLMSKAYLIVTDSGGIQEEAPALGKPVLVIRETTERPEAVEAGVARLIGTDKGAIIENINDLLENQSAYSDMASAVSPFGDGTAAYQIVELLEGLIRS